MTTRREDQLAWLITEIRRLIRDDPKSPGQGLRRGRLRQLSEELRALRSDRTAPFPD